MCVRVDQNNPSTIGKEIDTDICMGASVPLTNGAAECAWPSYCRYLVSGFY